MLCVISLYFFLSFSLRFFFFILYVQFYILNELEHKYRTFTKERERTRENWKRSKMNGIYRWMMALWGTGAYNIDIIWQMVLKLHIQNWNVRIRAAATAHGWKKKICKKKKYVKRALDASGFDVCVKCVLLFFPSLLFVGIESMEQLEISACLIENHDTL